MMITLEQLGLKKYDTKKQYQLFIGALNKAVAQYEKVPDVVAIFCFGSFVRGGLTEDSDLDIGVVKKSVLQPYTVSHAFNGVPVEILITSRKFLEADLVQEKRGLIRRTTSILASSRSVFSTDQTYNGLYKKASAIHVSKLPQLSKEEVANYKKTFDKQKEVLMSYLRAGDTLNFNLRLQFGVNDMVNKYFRIKRIPLPQFKNMSGEITDRIFKENLIRMVAAKTDSKKLMYYLKVVSWLRSTLA